MSSYVVGLYASHKLPHEIGNMVSFSDGLFIEGSFWRVLCGVLKMVDGLSILLYLTMTMFLASPVLVDVSQKQHRMSYHGGSNEDVEGPERSSRSRRIEPPSRAFSTSTIHLSGTSSLRSQQPGRPKGKAVSRVIDKLEENKE